MTDIVIYSAGSSPFLRPEYLSAEASTSVSRPTPNDIQATYTLPFQHLSPNPTTTTTTTFYYGHNDRNSSSSPSFLFEPINSNSIPMMNNANRSIPVEILPRRLSNSEQHYDYPANIIEQHRIPTIVPFNSLKRMDRLNTIFVKPTRIERPLPKLVFQENEIEESKTNEISSQQESEQLQNDSCPSSPIFFEQAGLPEIDDDEEEDDDDEQRRRGKRVKFTTAPIRVYPTYSPSEYDRRNEDIDPFSASAEYELEKRIEKMTLFEVEIEKGSEGLGMSVLGMGVGADSGLEKLGIFVKALNPQGLIARDGRIHVGDQIIEVNDNYMVGVTHQFATSVLKTTTGLIKFVIGREKDPENSEVLRLIQRSLQMDREREEFSQTTGTPTQDDASLKSAMTNEYELEILKECFESLEKTLENTEKERDHYQQLYQQTLKDFQQIEEKYRQANELIVEFQQRENQMKKEQIERQEQQQKYIGDLMRKIVDLEENIAQAKVEQLNDTSDLTPSSISDHIETNSHRHFSRSRPVEQEENPWQKQRSIQSKSMDRIEPMPSKDLFVRYSTKSICDHVGTQDVINHSVLLFTTPTIGAAALANNDNSLIDEYIEVKDWSSDNCIQWLTNENLSEFIPLFLNRNIDGEKLLSLDSSKMKAMGIKSSKDRDRLKQKLKELKHSDLDQIRDRLLSEQIVTIERPPTTTTKSHRFRSSSLNKLKDRRFFSTNNSNLSQKK